MSKLKLTKEDTKNIMKMLTSSDEENKVIGLKALNNADLTDYYGELIILFKFSKNTKSLWMNEAPNAWAQISEFMDSSNNLPTGTCLSEMISKNVKKEALEMFFEYFVEDMTGYLNQLGFPVETFELNIKLK